jgi:Xaa-Pro aminopeptidase
MSSVPSTSSFPPEGDPQARAEILRLRRADVDGKQTLVADLIQQAGCEGLLVLRPENFAWLSGGAGHEGVLDPSDCPALYFTIENRWLISCNADSQRLFDEELDGLGFQLKEWPWHWGRAQCLADLCEVRVVGCDKPMRDSIVLAEPLARVRRVLTPFEQARYRELGQTVSHALEATCRTMAPNLSEREVAGQLGHRLLHRGVRPVALGVAADDRARNYRHFGFTDQAVQKHCLLQVTATKYGLHVTASRSVCFGAPDQALRQEYDTACKVTAAYVYATRVSTAPREILHAGRRVYLLSGYEHEWLTGPQGHLTGQAAVEMMLRPNTEELLQAGWAITWNAAAGAAVSCDSFLITERGAECVTPMEAWPVKRLRVQGEEIIRPYLLVR